MAEVINLNRARKAREKAEAKAVAAENRRKFGRAKSETEAERCRAEIEARRLDGHKRDGEPE